MCIKPAMQTIISAIAETRFPTSFILPRLDGLGKTSAPYSTTRIHTRRNDGWNYTIPTCSSRDKSFFIIPTYGLRD